MRSMTRGAVAIALAGALVACSDSATEPAPIALDAQALSVAGVVNLSGTWKLDPARSVFPNGGTGRPTGAGGRRGGRPGGSGQRPEGVAFDGKLTITQSATSITVNGRTIKTDGSVQTPPPGRGGPGMSLSASWSGTSLIVTAKIPSGQELRQQLSVSDDGKTLTVDAAGPNGESMKKVFGRS